MFSSENFKEIMKRTGYTYDRLSYETGISRASLLAYSAEKTKNIPIEKLVKIADVLSCSVDYLIGREDSADLDEIIKQRSKVLRNVIEAKYVGKTVSEIPRSESYRWVPAEGSFPISVWPYNLLEDIFAINHADYKNADQQLTIPISTKQEKALEDALDTLTNNEKEVLLLYYRDEMTQTEIAEKYNLERGRISQIIKKGVRKLRHPSRTRLILQYDLTWRENKINEEEKRLDEYKKQLEIIEKNYLEQGIIVNDIAFSRWQTPIEKLNLTVRSFNCLKRVGINTVSDLYTTVMSGKLQQVRNLNSKCCDEIINALNDQNLIMSKGPEFNKIKLGLECKSDEVII